jgi:hypothetical protein
MRPKIIFPLLFIILFAACNYVTYTPRSKKNIQREKPSVVLLNSIIDYRLEQNIWPFSKEDFISKGRKYKEAFEGFPYLLIKFKIIDNDKMIFYFNEHKKDVQKYKETNMVDLHSYSGYVKFYKENDKFIWKLKMK